MSVSMASFKSGSCSRCLILLCITSNHFYKSHYYLVIYAAWQRNHLRHLINHHYPDHHHFLPILLYGRKGEREIRCKCISNRRRCDQSIDHKNRHDGRSLSEFLSPGLCKCRRLEKVVRYVCRYKAQFSTEASTSDSTRQCFPVLKAVSTPFLIKKILFLENRVSSLHDHIG